MIAQLVLAFLAVAASGDTQCSESVDGTCSWKQHDTSDAAALLQGGLRVNGEISAQHASDRIGKSSLAENVEDEFDEQDMLEIPSAPASSGYTMYRFVCTKTKVPWPKYGWWGLSEIELKASGKSVMAGATVEHAGVHPHRMDAPSSIDGTTRSFLDKPEHGTAVKTATAENTPTPLMIKLRTRSKVTNFRFRTLVTGFWNGWAGQEGGWSDPIQWRLEGSNDGQTWTPVQEQTSDYATPATRAAWTEWFDVKTSSGPPAPAPLPPARTPAPTMAPPTPAPTPAPTLAPRTPAPRPAPRPVPTTPVPTLAPTTPAPTLPPTLAPRTPAPRPAPRPVPTTPVPTLAPTTPAPTLPPTLAPTTPAPTPAPTLPPTPGPTPAPAPASPDDGFWCSSNDQCKKRHSSFAYPFCRQGECMDLSSMRNQPPTKPGCWVQCPSGCKHKKFERECQLWTHWKYGEQRGALTKKDYCLKGVGSNNGYCGVKEFIAVFVSPDGKDIGYSYPTPKIATPPPPPPTSKGSHFLAVDMPAKIEQFPGTKWSIIGSKPTWATKAAASKTDKDLVYVAWTEEGNTGDGIPVHLSKLSISGGKLIKDRSFAGGYDRAGGIDTTPDGRVGFLITKRIKQWEEEYFQGKDNIGSMDRHWHEKGGGLNGGPMLLAMVELKEADLTDAREKWVAGNFWMLKNEDRRNGYSHWGNYPVAYWGSSPVAGHGEVTFIPTTTSQKTFGDLGDVWFIEYGTTIGHHQAATTVFISDKKLTFTETCAPTGKKIEGCGPTKLPDGIKMRSTKAEWSGGLGGKHNFVPEGHPQQGSLAFNSDGAMCWCSQGDARGPTCFERRAGLHGDKFVLTTIPWAGGLTESLADVVPRPSGKGWMFAYGKGILYFDKINAYTVPKHVSNVAACVSVKGGTKKEEWCNGSGLHTKKGERCEAWCNKIPEGKIVSKKGQMVDHVTVRVAKLGNANTDRYLIGYQADGEMWILEVDGDCAPKYGPVMVAGSKDKLLWGYTMKWTTTVDGKIVSVAPNPEKEDSVLIFTHECQSC